MTSSRSTDRCLPMNLDDTIVAIATPPGRGGIGVVRLAGPDARIIAAPMLRLTHPLEPGRAVHCELVEPTTQPSTRHFGTVDELAELLHPVKPTPGLTGAPVRSAGQGGGPAPPSAPRSEQHTAELQTPMHFACP